MSAVHQAGPELAGHPVPVPLRELRRERPSAPAEQSPVILIVESDWANRRLLREMLGEEGCRLLEASRATEAFETLQRTRVDLIIADLVLPDAGGVEFCRQVKADRGTFLIPVVLISSAPGVEMQVAGLAAGADEFLVRPLNTPVVRARVAALLRQKAAVDSLEEAESLLLVLARVIEHRDEAISGHCQRLDEISAAMGAALGLSPANLLALHRGAYLHDIGKVGVPDAILFKPGPLSRREWAIIREHPIRGEEICRPVKSLAPVLPIIRGHHERWDGSGYPDGLAGEDIPLLARILQIADIYDALTSPRPYKRPLPGPQALDILEEETRRGWRDPRLVRLFRRLSETTLWPAQQVALARAVSADVPRKSPEEVPALSRS